MRNALSEVENLITNVINNVTGNTITIDGCERQYKMLKTSLQSFFNNGMLQCHFCTISGLEYNKNLK